ncbi:YaeQ family protein [Oceaniserpentilla sp. 4NH20-0058]|uniref:YaeQ family protein n=1 Tax=Oceaniserpentilla sp. 4NH20-0058 TaxID=3127660 RepID=UPI0031082BB5
MALNADIFKVQVHISDMDRHYYQSHALTIAQHPSENDLRMMVRLMAFILNATEELSFTKGLSSQDEPELWQKTLSDEIELWIELGQIEEKRLRQACGKAQKVIIYTYHDKQAEPWYAQMQKSFARQKDLNVYHINSETCEELAKLVTKNMDIQVSIQDGEVFISSDQGQVSFTPTLRYPV